MEYVALPVPFYLDSEGYAVRHGPSSSPHVRFLPSMHDLEPEGPRSAEVIKLLASEEVESQFSSTSTHPSSKGHTE
ncbi:unnamed protein product [Discosporangium mesarthrocarpum]